MNNEPTFDFIDTVEKIEENDLNYSVIFTQHAAVYSIDKESNEAINLLKSVEMKKLPVKIIHRLRDSKIVQVLSDFKEPWNAYI